MCGCSNLLPIKDLVQEILKKNLMSLYIRIRPFNAIFEVKRTAKSLYFDRPVNALFRTKEPQCPLHQGSMVFVSRDLKKEPQVPFLGNGRQRALLVKEPRAMKYSVSKPRPL